MRMPWFKLEREKRRKLEENWIIRNEWGIGNILVFVIIVPFVENYKYLHVKFNDI
jgi:hypothetical protein